MGYPEGLDCVWLTSNESGQAAAFVTAGEGPIPEALVAAVDLATEDLEGLLLALPVVTEGVVKVSVGDMSSFIEMGKRGFFVYDWSDVHRVTDTLKAYELVVVPRSPIMLHQCLGRIGEVLRLAPLNARIFEPLVLPQAPVVWPWR